MTSTYDRLRVKFRLNGYFIAEDAQSILEEDTDLRIVISP